MFSRRTVVIGGVLLFFTVNLALLALSVRNRLAPDSSDVIAISLIGPFQKVASASIRSVKQIWECYFFHVRTSENNRRLQQELRVSRQSLHSLKELELANERLRNLLDFKKKIESDVVIAEVIAKDPSPWFRSLMIDKGSDDGLRVALPVITYEGVVGITTHVAKSYARVLLIIDQNCSVDGLIQRTRARGILKGTANYSCIFDYVMKRNDVQPGDTVISSGLDGVFPKGLPVGSVREVIRESTGIFQEVEVTPLVNFETLEEVMVVLTPVQDRNSGEIESDS